MPIKEKLVLKSCLHVSNSLKPRVCRISTSWLLEYVFLACVAFQATRNNASNISKDNSLPMIFPAKVGADISLITTVSKNAMEVKSSAKTTALRIPKPVVDT